MEWDRVDTARGTSCRVLRGGKGHPVVFLHGFGGLRESEPMLEQLALHYAVLAPELPGFGHSTGEELLEDMLDFTLHGWDVVDELGIDHPHLVAHSMGGMIAAEMASVCPERPRKLALLAPLGLWIDEAPIPDLFATLPHQLPELLFHDPAAGVAALTGGLDFSDDTALVEFFVGNARRLGTAGKIMFPIPNRRLSKRLHRLRAETLLLWGDDDRFVPPIYGDRWLELVPHAAIATIADAGHLAADEHPDAVAEAITRFLG